MLSGQIKPVPNFTDNEGSYLVKADKNGFKNSFPFRFSNYLWNVCIVKLKTLSYFLLIPWISQLIEKNADDNFVEFTVLLVTKTMQIQFSIYINFLCSLSLSGLSGYNVDFKVLMIVPDIESFLFHLVEANCIHNRNILQYSPLTEVCMPNVKNDFYLFLSPLPRRRSLSLLNNQQAEP